MSDLKNKRILLFSSLFFNYHNIVAEALRRRGAEVRVYDERNDPTSVEKILLKKARFLMERKTAAYYDAVAKKEQDFSPDYIFFISPEAVTKRCIKALRKAFPESTFLLYMWDSVKNKQAKGIIRSFDDVLSFDPKDCKKYGLKFRPLFFSKEREIDDSDEDFKYDISFIGTVHSDRARILLEIKDFCEKNGLKYYFYLYIPGKLLLFLRMLTDPALRKWEKKYIHTSQMDKKAVEEIQSASRCTIDINHPKQTGLTMRTIEMVGMKRKIATTNQNIKEYDFYRPQNQIVLDRKDMVLSRDELTQGYRQIPDEIQHRYSLDAWIDDVFSLNYNN